MAPQTAALTPHSTPLSRADVAHLLRRTQFHLDPALLDTLTGQTAEAAVQHLLTLSTDAPKPPEPDWLSERLPGRTATAEEREAFLEANRTWFDDLATAWLPAQRTVGLRERLLLFWLNHFVTESQVYRYAYYAYRYLDLLRTQALGNVRTLTHAIGLEPAMLLYLNGTQNEDSAPNENYARELLELFTMGPTAPDGSPNYTQADITDLARALTGWLVNGQTFEVLFVQRRHDAGEKTFLGRTGTFGYDDALDVIFEERTAELAHFIASKLYRHFVHPDVDAEVVQAMADLFVANDFEIEPVVTTLFSSAAFFNPTIRGAHIKSPILFLHTLAAPLYPDAGPQLDSQLFRSAALLGQQLLRPPNVAGWPGYRDWIDTTTFPLRWQYGEALLQRVRGGGRPAFVPLCEQLHDPNAQDAVFHLALALAEYTIAVPIDGLDLPNLSSQPYAGNLDGHPLPEWVLNAPPYQESLFKQFLAGIPWYEWSLYRDGAETLIQAYLLALMQQPEFQLT